MKVPFLLIFSSSIALTANTDSFKILQKVTPGLTRTEVTTYSDGKPATLDNISCLTQQKIDETANALLASEGTCKGEILKDTPTEAVAHVTCDIEGEKSDDIITQSRPEKNKLLTEMKTVKGELKLKTISTYLGPCK